MCRQLADDGLATRVVALDFDGVVWDSVDEAFEMAWRTWNEQHGVPVLSKDGMRLEFRRARWQCKDGHDFYLATHLLATSPPRDVGAMSAAEFRRLREETCASEDSARFVKAFYGARSAMRDHDRAAWMALQRPFPGIPQQVARLRDLTRGVAIATTKDEASARALLDDVGLGDIPVYGREVSLDKRDHMRAIAQAFEVPLAHVAFVDDLLENLQPLAPLGVRLGLAGWGYNTPEEHERAIAAGVPVLSLEQFASGVEGLFH